MLVSPDGARVAVATDRVIRLQALASGGKAAQLKGHKDAGTSLAFAADGALLASGGDDRMVHVWDARAAAAMIKPLKGHTGTVTGVAFAGAGRLVSASHDQTLRVW